MKKLLSVLMTVAMLISCVAFTTNAMAEDVPELTLDKGVTFTFPKNGKEEEAIKAAKFVPTEDGWYTFTADAEYKNTKGTGEDDFPGGVFAVDLVEPDYQATQGMAFFMDISSLTEEQKKELEDGGVDVAHLGTLKTAAKLEAGKTYYVLGYQDGDEDYTATVTVEKHEHTIKQVERKGEESLPDGMYETCEDWFCMYDELVTPYHVTYEVIEGANQTIQRGEALKFTANGPFDKYRSLEVDGEELTDDFFSVQEGSTIVTLNAEYLDTLKAGKHTATVVYVDGEASTDFTIEETATSADSTAGKTSTTSKDTSSTSPATGAETVLVAMAGMAAGALLLEFMRRRKSVKE